MSEAHRQHSDGEGTPADRQCACALMLVSLNFLMSPVLSALSVLNHDLNIRYPCQPPWAVAAGQRCGAAEREKGGTGGAGSALGGKQSVPGDPACIQCGVAGGIAPAGMRGAGRHSVSSL